MRGRDRWDRGLEWGIAGTLFAILALVPLLFGGVQTFGFLVLGWLTLLAGLLWGARVWISKSPRLLWTPASWFVLAFVAYVWWRYPDAAVEYPAREEAIKVTLYALLFFIGLNNLYRQEVCQAFVFVALCLGMLLSFYATYQFVTNSPYVWKEVKPAMFMHRGSATFFCPNHFAGFLEMIFPLGVAFTLSSRLKDAPRVLVGYASLAILVGIGVSVSRGAWISTGLAMACLFIWFSRKPQFRIPSLIAMALLVLGAAYGINNAHNIQRRFEQMVSQGTPDDVSSRKLIWQTAYSMWQTSPWLGLGPGQFDSHFVSFRPVDLQWRPANVHNDYLNALVDHGVVGAGVIGLFFLAMFVGVVRTWKFVDRSANDLETKASNRSAFVMGACIGLLALLLHAFIEFNFYIPANAVQAVLILALLSSHSRFASDRYWVSLRVPGRTVLSVVLLFTVIWVSPRLWQRSVEGYWLGRAGAATDSEARLRAYERAAAVDPRNSETLYAIGEIIRLLAWDQPSEGKLKALDAIDWFKKGIAANPFDTHNYIRLGMSLHLLDRKSEAEPWFQKAVSVDPKNHFVAAHMGWHYFDRRDFDRAKEWFERSLQIKNWENHTADYYLQAIARLKAGGTP